MWDSLASILILTKKSSRSLLASRLMASRSTDKALSGVLLYGELTAQERQSMRVALDSLLRQSPGIYTLHCVIETVTSVGDPISLEEDERLPF